MFSINLKIAVVVLLMQKSCCPFDFQLAKQLLIESTQVFARQERECKSPGGTALFINPAEKISC
jgi:hypothetical protein